MITISKLAVDLAIEFRHLLQFLHRQSRSCRDLVDNPRTLKLEVLGSNPLAAAASVPLPGQGTHCLVPRRGLKAIGLQVAHS